MPFSQRLHVTNRDGWRTIALAAFNFYSLNLFKDGRLLGNLGAVTLGVLDRCLVAKMLILPVGATRAYHKRMILLNH